MKLPPPPECSLCSTVVDADDFCEGCQAYICDQCEPNFDPPKGLHYPEDHQGWDEDEGGDTGWDGSDPYYDDDVVDVPLEDNDDDS